MAGGREYDQERFENLVLYLAARSESDPGFGKVKLNKLLFRSDFEAFRLLGHSITGEQYKHQDLGPVAAHLPSALRRMSGEGVIEIQHIGEAPFTREVPSLTKRRMPDEKVFSDEELAIIERSIVELEGKGAKKASDWSHEVSIGWRVTKTNQEIPYSSAPLSIRALSDRADSALRALVSAS